MIITDLFRFSLPIWKILPCYNQTSLAVELLEKQLLKLQLLKLDLVTKTIKWLSEYPSNQNAAFFSKDFIVVKNFPSTKVPVSQGMTVLDAQFGKILWQNPEYHFLEGNSYQGKITFFNEIQIVDLQRGNKMQTFENDDTEKIVWKFPNIQNHIPQFYHEVIEYEKFNAEVIQKEENNFETQFFLKQNGDTLYFDELKEMKGWTEGLIFGVGNSAIYLKDNKTLVMVTIA